MALRGNRPDSVNTKGFENKKTSDSNSRSNMGSQGGGGSTVSGPSVPMTDNPKGRTPMRVGGTSRKSAGDLIGQPISENKFTTSQGKK